MDIFKCILTIVISYLLGSVNIAVVISTVFFKKDIRTLGSNNAGSTNMARVFSIGAGLATLAGDILKTVVAIFIGEYYLGLEDGLIVSSVFCLVGHCRPVFFRFKGGKGVAVSAGIALMLDWRVFLIALVVFAMTALISRIVSLSSIIAIASFPIANILLNGFYLPEFVLCIFVMLAVVYLHRENLKRLFDKTEQKFSVARPPRKRSQASK